LEQHFYQSLNVLRCHIQYNPYLALSIYHEDLAVLLLQ
jgi:hypothetical protein